MSFTDMKLGFTRSIARAGLRIKKDSPLLLLIGGITGTGVAAYLAGKATYTLADLLENDRKEKEEIKQKLESNVIDEATAKEEIKTVKIKTGFALLKKYGIALGVWTASTVALVASYKIEHARTLALAATVESLSLAFNEYCKRNIAEKGIEYHNHLMSGEEIKTEAVVNPDGTITEKKTAIQGSMKPINPYHYEYGPGCPNYEKLPVHGLNYLTSQFEYLDRKLKHQGFIYAWEIAEWLGVKYEKHDMTAGFVVGMDGYDTLLDVIYKCKEMAINAPYREGRDKTFHIYLNPLPDITSVLFPEKEPIRGVRNPAIA